MKRAALGDVISTMNPAVQEESTEARRELGLRHKYYLCGDRSAPLVFLIHGRAGTFDVMWAFRRCLPEHCNIIAPQAPEPDELGGYSWWDVNVGGASLEAATPSLQLLQRFINASPAHYSLEPQAQIALGFSQGAGILSLLLQSGAHPLSGVALLAGFVIEAADASAPPRPRVFMAHGTNDDIIPVSRALRGKEFLEKRGFEVEFHEDAVGHKVGAPSMRHLTDWSASVLGIKNSAA